MEWAGSRNRQTDKQTDTAFVCSVKLTEVVTCDETVARLML